MAGVWSDAAAGSEEGVRSGRGRAAREPGAAPSRRRRGWLRLAVVVLIAAGLALRLGYVAATPDYRIAHDARDYDVHATSVARGEGFSDRLARRPTAFRPPGFPYLLGGVYKLADVERSPVAERIETARLAQALIGTVVVALTGILAAQLWGWGAGLVALALAALYLPLILVGGAIMSEPLFVALMLAALVTAVHHRRSPHRYRWALVAGVTAGLAALTRANGLVLLLPLAAAVWDSRPRLSLRALAPPAALVATALLVIMPWTIRNAVELESFVPVSTQLGSALAGTYNDAARTDEENPASWRALKHVPDYRHLLLDWPGTPEAELDRKLRRAALLYIADHPRYVAAVLYWSTRRTLDLAGRDWSRHTASTISVDRSWADAGVVCFWIFAALAAAGLALRRARRVPLFVIAVPVLMFASVAFIVVETPRYRTALDPFVVMLAALAVTAAGARLLRRQR